MSSKHNTVKIMRIKFALRPFANYDFNDLRTRKTPVPTLALTLKGKGFISSIMKPTG